MRTSTNLSRLAAMVAVVMAVAASAASCGKKQPSQPVVEKYPAKEFTLSLIETRQLKTFQWAVSPTGQTDNGEEEIKTLCVTKFNHVTLTSTADVNVESSDPSVVSVNRSSSRNYVLAFEDNEGYATIRVWNGDASSKKEVKIQVQGRPFVPIEGIVFRYGPTPEQEETIVAKRFSLTRPLLRCHYPGDEANEHDGPMSSRPSTGDISIKKWMWNRGMVWSDEKETFITDTSQGALLTFVGITPENASFRTVRAFESEWSSDGGGNWQGRLAIYGFYEEGTYHWPNVYSCENDVSDFVGIDTWVCGPVDGRIYMACLKFDVEDNGARYFYLYHATEPEGPTGEDW